MPLPGFTAIKDATSAGSHVSLIGVIVSIKEQKKTRGTDWVLEFSIQDDFTTGTVGSLSSISCRVFRPNPSMFPKIRRAGDIALVRNFKLSSWGSRLDCVNASISGLLIFPASGIPSPALGQVHLSSSIDLPFSSMSGGSNQLTLQEKSFIVQLKHGASGLAHEVRQHAATSSFQTPGADKLSLIKDFDIGRFYDVRAQVVNMYYNNFGSVELKVTDYTSNKDLYLRVHPSDKDACFQDQKWQGPYGQLTLDVRLYGNNGVWARENLTVGDFVFLKNVRTKMSPENKLEGALHEDRDRPDQVDIRKLLSPSDIEEINKRRAQYEQHYSDKAPALRSLNYEPEKLSTKATASKKAEKRERQRLQREQELNEIEKKEREWDAARTGINTNIRAAFPEMLTSTISEIVYNRRLQAQTPKYNDFTLPFLNCRHRSRVRAIDFFPPTLDFFAHCTSDPAWDKRLRKKAEDNGSVKERWEWGFVLLLEDATVPPNTVSEKLRLVVGNDAGQHLLGMNARNLANDQRALKTIQEKLFILWGNLLELKNDLRDMGKDLPLPPGDNRLQNKPFDCCIEEYGHEVPVTERNPSGFQRMHKLAGTRIMVDV